VAIHSVVVSDLTSDAFLASLMRFFSRIGKSAKMFSNSGKKFVGTARKLENKQNEWHFVPPAGICKICKISP